MAMTVKQKIIIITTFTQPSTRVIPVCRVEKKLQFILYVLTAVVISGNIHGQYLGIPRESSVPADRGPQIENLTRPAS